LLALVKKIFIPASLIQFQIGDWRLLFIIIFGMIRNSRACGTYLEFLYIKTIIAPLRFLPFFLFVFPISFDLFNQKDIIFLVFLTLALLFQLFAGKKAILYQSYFLSRQGTLSVYI